jgi:hypothetical protein
MGGPSLSKAPFFIYCWLEGLERLLGCIDDDDDDDDDDDVKNKITGKIFFMMYIGANMLLKISSTN